MDDPDDDDRVLTRAEVAELIAKVTGRPLQSVDYWSDRFAEIRAARPDDPHAHGQKLGHQGWTGSLLGRPPKIFSKFTAVPPT